MFVGQTKKATGAHAIIASQYAHKKARRERWLATVRLLLSVASGRIKL